MTLFIQRAEHRDTQTIQAKLDELLKANHDATNEVTRVDDKEPEEIDEFREGLRDGGLGRESLRGPPSAAVLQQMLDGQ